jgi:hypothetical protein
MQQTPFYHVAVRCVSFARMHEIYITYHRQRKQGGRKWHQFAMASMRRCHIRDIVVCVIGGIVNCIPTKQLENHKGMFPAQFMDV